MHNTINLFDNLLTGSVQLYQQVWWEKLSGCEYRWNWCTETLERDVLIAPLAYSPSTSKVSLNKDLRSFPRDDASNRFQIFPRHGPNSILRFWWDVNSEEESGLADSRRDEDARRSHW